MTNVALILVTDPQKSLEDHLGIPLLKRTVLSAQEGGIEKFIIVAEDARERLSTLLSGDDRVRSTIHWSDGDNLSDQLKGRLSESIMIIKAEAVFDSDLIEKMDLLELGDAAACIAVRKGVKGSGAGQCTIKLSGDDVVDCSVQSSTEASPPFVGRDPYRTDGNRSHDATIDAQTAGLILARPDASKGIAVKVANGHIDLCNIVEGLLSVGKVRAIDVTNELCMEITSRETVQESKKKMYKLLGLATDSPFSVHVNRKLSRLVSGVLIRFPITPNQITLLSFFTGLVACWFFLQGGYRYSVLGAMVFYASVILDLSDGEVARLKFMGSKYGAVFDTICDSIVYSGVMFCMALAIHRSTHMPNAITVGAVAAGAMFICSNLDFYLHFMETDREKDQRNPLMRSFANEDYFLLSLLGFTVFDKLSWYLWTVAAGTTVYMFMLIGKLMISRFSGEKAQ
ncbi:MAG: CDP-alcohol phosphatidyltransferase family protein [Candidatus Brocadiales bacterium]